MEVEPDVQACEGIQDHEATSTASLAEKETFEKFFDMVDTKIQERLRECFVSAGKKTKQTLIVSKN